MDFSHVKSLTIPEGEVTKITDSSGNVLWQKITQGWHTLWEGSVTSHNGSSPIDVATLSELSGEVKLRVYWSCNMSGGSDMTDTYFFNKGAATTTDKPDSPFEFDLDAGKPRLQIIGGIRHNSGTSQGRSCQLK